MTLHFEDRSDTTTVVDLLEHRLSETPNATAFLHLSAENQTWKKLDWSAYCSIVDSLTNYFAAAGFTKGDCLAIVAPTQIMWELSQAAAWKAGLCVAGIDHQYSDDQLQAVLTAINPVGVIVANNDALARIPPQIGSQCKLLCSLVELREHAEKMPPSEHHLSALRPAAHDAAIITFSSGTTGTPKPIKYSHGQLYWATRGLSEAFADINAGATLVCWMPMANLFQRMVNLFGLARGAQTYIVEDPRAIMETLPRIEPDLFIGVPRFFEKVHAAANVRITKMPNALRSFVNWAVNIADAYAECIRTKGRATGWLSFKWRIVDRLVLAKLRAPFGTKLRYFISGSAPMSSWLLQWFDAIGLPVLEAYGVSENILPVAANRWNLRKLGSVGKPMPGNDVRISAEGEILVNGPGVFNGYLGSGYREKQRDENGFLHTGDLGNLDDDGFLYVTGRKTDVFKTSTGRWVTPSKIEERLRRLPYIDYALVFGAGHKAVVALLSLVESEDVKGVASSSSGLASSLASDIPEVLNDLPGYQHPVGFLIVAEQFSVAGQELTYNAKVRRSFIESKYREPLSRLYMKLDGANVGHGNASIPSTIIIEHA